MITLLCPWIGPLPAWLPRFLDRVRANQAVARVRLMTVTADQVAGAADRAGLPRPERIDGRKLCDFRPAFGELLAGQLRGVPWWGWCDLDVVLGDLGRFLTPELLARHDLVTDHYNAVNGPLTVLRNCPQVNGLFRRHPGWQELLADQRHHAFDEVGFTEAVRRSGARAAFLDAHRHDGEPGEVRLDGGRLLHAGREIMTYHFKKTKRWPL